MTTGLLPKLPSALSGLLGGDIMFNTHVATIQHPTFTQDEAGGDVPNYTTLLFSGQSVVSGNLQSMGGSSGSRVGFLMQDFERRGIAVRWCFYTPVNITVSDSGVNVGDGDLITVNGIGYWIRQITDAGGRGRVFECYLELVS